MKLDGNRFTAIGVAVGEQAVTVTAPGHKACEGAVEVIPGENKLKV